MAMTEPHLDSDVPRPQPGGRSRAELVETAQGWVLTLTLDAGTAVQVRRQLAGGRDPGWFVPRDFEVSIAPNLVPGAPFPLSAVEIIVE